MLGGWTINNVSAKGTPLVTYGNAQNPHLNLAVNVRSGISLTQQPLTITFQDDGFTDTSAVNWAATIAGINQLNGSIGQGVNVSFAAYLNGSSTAFFSSSKSGIQNAFTNTATGTYPPLTGYNLKLVIVVSKTIRNHDAANVTFDLDGTEQATPEPTLYSALGLGLGGLAFFARRRQRA
jgi:hypothetical protein